MNLSRDAVESDTVFVVKISGTFGCDRVVGERKVGLTSHVVDVRADRCVVPRYWQLRDEIYAHNFPGVVWNVVGLEKCLGVLCRLVALTFVTFKDIFLNERGHVWPPVVALDQFNCAVFARVSGGGGVVTCLDDFTAEFVVIWNVQFALVIQ